MYFTILRFCRRYVNFCETVLGLNNTAERPDIKAVNELLTLTGGYYLNGAYHYPEVLPKYRDRIIELCEFVLAYQVYDNFSNEEMAKILIETGSEVDSQQAKKLKQAGEHILNTQKNMKELLSRAENT